MFSILADLNGKRVSLLVGGHFIEGLIASVQDGYVKLATATDGTWIISIDEVAMVKEITC